jgi:hypothetical protein
MSPLASWTLVGVVVGLPALSLYCCLVLSKRAERNAEPLHTHTCSRCGRIQRWTEPFDQASPCRACQIWKPEHVELEPAYLRRPYDNQVHGHRVSGAPTLELDLEDFADGDAIRAALIPSSPKFG